MAEPNRPQPESRAVGAASRSAVWGASRGAARPRHVDTALQCPPSRPGLASRRGRLSATLKTEPAVPGSTALWVWTSWPGGSQHPKRGFNGRVGVFWTCRKGHLGREQLRRRPRGREGLRRCGAHRGARGHPLSRPPLRRLHWSLLFPPTLGLFPRASSLHLHPAPGTPRPTPTPPLPSIHTRFSVCLHGHLRGLQTHLCKPRVLAGSSSWVFSGHRKHARPGPPAPPTASSGQLWEPDSPLLLTSRVPSVIPGPRTHSPASASVC